MSSENLEKNLVILVEKLEIYRTRLMKISHNH